MESYKTVLAAVLLLAAVAVSGCTSTGNVATRVDAGTGAVKEFYMESFYTIEDGKPHPQFSVKEIAVDRGDTVRIHVNATNGAHDFKIDEFGVYSPTPTGQVTTIEFVAGESGEFVYYCNMPQHRQNGQWGTLKVLA
ncbi:MAG: hypothetical protein HY518_00445 [Candidatus Aenigmarchaeota archaeon]|nr:hypothetical protein [Candidatus Aenigmarchaeota archaeon]